MAVIPILPNQIAPTNETQYVARSFLPAATIGQGQVCLWDANRKLTLTGGTAPAAGAEIAGIALRSDRAGGQAITLLQEGFLTGYDMTGLALYVIVYAGTNGAIDTAGTVIIGQVLPFNASGDLRIYFNVMRSWLVS